LAEVRALTHFSAAWANAASRRAFAASGFDSAFAAVLCASASAGDAAALPVCFGSARAGFPRELELLLPILVMKRRFLSPPGKTQSRFRHNRSLPMRRATTTFDGKFIRRGRGAVRGQDT
jgi:hypothetical protein